jgi:hypothetical protein
VIEPIATARRHPSSPCLLPFGRRLSNKGAHDRHRQERLLLHKSEETSRRRHRYRGECRGASPHDTAGCMIDTQDVDWIYPHAIQIDAAASSSDITTCRATAPGPLAPLPRTRPTGTPAPCISTRCGARGRRRTGPMGLSFRYGQPTLPIRSFECSWTGYSTHAVTLNESQRLRRRQYCPHIGTGHSFTRTKTTQKGAGDDPAPDRHFQDRARITPESHMLLPSSTNPTRAFPSRHTLDEHRDDMAHGV